MAFPRTALPLLALAPALLILSACGDDDSEDIGTSVPTATQEETTPSPTPLIGDEATLVFIRGPEEPYQQHGSLWISDAGGAGARQISPEGLTAAFAGLGTDEDGGRVLYYVTADTETERTVYTYDFSSSESAAVFSYQTSANYVSVGVSPDGTMIVYSDQAAMYLHDLLTDETRRLFTFGDREACHEFVIAECHAYTSPRWSADGRLLLATRTVYEGGWVQVIDPFVDPPVTLIEESRAVPGLGHWSPDSDAVCASGLYAENSGLYLFQAPDWQTDNRFPEYEVWETNPEGRSVLDCDWAGASEVAYLTALQTPDRGAEFNLLDTTSREWRTVRKLNLVTCCTGLVTAIDGLPAVVVQLPQEEYGKTHFWAPPLVVDIETGELQQILGQGDVIVAAFAN